MMDISELSSRLRSRQRPCSYRECARKIEWSDLLHRDAGIELDGQWLCSENCFLAAARDLLASIGEVRSPAVSTRTALPLGLIMVSRGDLTAAQLRIALDYQQKICPSKKIGNVLRDFGVVAEGQITRALAEQWSCPIFPLQPPEDLTVPDLLPLHLLETYGVVPVHFTSGAKMMLLGFTEALHHSVLYATEKMLNCRTEACLISPSLYSRQLESLRFRGTSTQIVIETMSSATEAAQIVRNYALQLSCNRVRVVSCGRYLWIRLEPKSLDILLRIPFSPGPRKDGFLPYGM